MPEPIRYGLDNPHPLSPMKSDPEKDQRVNLCLVPPLR
jgi:hypothetical protein